MIAYVLCRKELGNYLKVELKIIEYQAFADCSKLQSIVIPPGAAVIKNEAFKGCAGLTSVTIPDSVTAVEEQAFAGCANLKAVSVPQNTQIAESAFPKHTKITKR